MTARTAFLPLACLGSALLILTATLASAGAPRLYLSWHAPYGAARASDTLSVTAGTEGGQDTLYLTFETGTHSEQFVGIEGTLYFRAPVGDTLGPHWRAGDENIQAQFTTDSVPGCTRPWRGAQALSFNFYDYTSGSGRLRLSHVRPRTRPVTVRDSVPYLYARLLLARPPAGLPRSDQPMCIEWATAEFLMDTTGGPEPPVAAGRGGHPLVSLNSRGGAVCSASMPEPPAKPKRPEVRRPKAKTGSRK
ncbi:MAG TPA: hypothetical protein VGK93_08730 [Candidatus Eisenbacteria bacterium]|jgi:hypothetical protein